MAEQAAVDTQALLQEVEKPVDDLQMPDAGRIKAQFGLKEEEFSEGTQAKELNPEVKAKATDQVQSLLRIASAGPQEQEDARASIANIGLSLQKGVSAAISKNEFLNGKIKELSGKHAGEELEGDDIAKALLDLSDQVNEINPDKIDFSTNTLTRFLGKIFGTKVKRYFQKYQSASTVIKGIFDQLADGKNSLKRDNQTARKMQVDLKGKLIELRQTVDFLMEMRDQILAHIELKLESDSPEVAYLEEHILYPLGQRIRALHEQMTVCQQGWLAMGLIIATNEQLIFGITQAETVTRTALDIGVAVAFALNRQRVVLKSLEAVQATTNRLVASNADRLEQQVTATYKRAAEAQMDVEVLKTSFTKINSAMTQIREFRRNALPQMAKSIVELNDLSLKGEEAIAEWEMGTAASSKNFSIDGASA